MQRVYKNWGIIKVNENTHYSYVGTEFRFVPFFVFHQIEPVFVNSLKCYSSTNAGNTLSSISHVICLSYFCITQYVVLRCNFVCYTA